jgi:methylmalonyl-CoA/ethylmalonyl-CoA epimerase
VVENIASSINGFIRSLDVTWDGQIFEDPLQRVKVTFLTTRPEEPKIELVEPVGDTSPVRKFLQETGGGLHHFCYETNDLEAEMQNMRARDAMLVRRPKPAVAFSGRRIAWLLTPERLLIELLESQP